jgi:hypothetical protein
VISNISFLGTLAMKLKVNAEKSSNIALAGCSWAKVEDV